MRRARAVALILSFAGSGPLWSQNLDSLIFRFAAFTTVSGYEQAVGDSLLALFPGATRDRLGTVSVTLGSGSPARVVACPLDEAGFAVGGISPDGYLTLRRDGRSPNPLFDQQLEGQRVTVLGTAGPIPGVVGVRSVHLTRGRGGPAADAPFTADDAWVDIGAASASEAMALGARLLAPVALTKTPLRYGDGLAAPAVGRHAACAALAAALLTRPRVAGRVTASFQAETLQGYQGGAAPAGASADTLIATLPVKYRDTAAETVMMSDVRALEQRLVRWIGGAE